MGTIERRSIEKEQRRNDIINAAENVFFTKGLNKTTMEQIAKEAELSKGTLYLYFNSKFDLVLAINTRGHRIMLNMLEQSVEQADNSIDKVKRIARTFLEFSKQHPTYAKMMHKYGPFRFNENNLTHIEYEKTMDKFYSTIYEVVQKAIDDNSSIKGRSVKKMVTMLLSLISGVFDISALEQNDTLKTKLDVDISSNYEEIYRIIDLLFK